MNDHALRRAHEADVARAERDRYVLLLGDALVLLCGLASDAGYSTEPGALLEVLGARRGMRLERPAWIEAAELRALELEEIRTANDDPEPPYVPARRRSLLGAPEPSLERPEPQLGGVSA